jgi:putative membrane protein insertion efficiency factor
VLAGVVLGYRWTLKPWLGSACRFEPSCSAYALEALGRHGAVAGSALTGWRLLRCHPWCDGGIDPVPACAVPAFLHPGAGLFTRLWPGARETASAANLRGAPQGPPPGHASIGGGSGFASAITTSHSFEPSRRGPCRPGHITGDLP